MLKLRRSPDGRRSKLGKEKLVARSCLRCQGNEEESHPLPWMRILCTPVDAPGILVSWHDVSSFHLPVSLPRFFVAVTHPPVQIIGRVDVGKESPVIPTIGIHRRSTRLTLRLVRRNSLRSYLLTLIISNAKFESEIRWSVAASIINIAAVL